MLKGKMLFTSESLRFHFGFYRHLYRFYRESYKNIQPRTCLGDCIIRYYLSRTNMIDRDLSTTGGTVGGVESKRDFHSDKIVCQYFCFHSCFNPSWWLIKNCPKGHACFFFRRPKNCTTNSPRVLTIYLKVLNYTIA